MTDRELMQMALRALEKLADETPTTHVRVGKAKIVDGKEIVALWFDDCSDPLQQAMYINATKPEKLKLFLKQVRDRLAQPEPDAVLVEREACAKVVEADGLARGKGGNGLVLLKAAERIRARGKI